MDENGKSGAITAEKKESRFMDDVGACIVHDGEIVKIDRKFYGQGFVFKSWRAYHEEPASPCYVPELSDSVYTANDFLDLCGGQKEFADSLFYECDWQHPETLFNDNIVNGEWAVCKCWNIIDIGGGELPARCPKCGKEMEE